MKILGIVPPHHDSSACVVSDGGIEAFVEQERMSREKHGSGLFPIDAIEEALRISDYFIADFDEIVFSRDYDAKKLQHLDLVRAGLRSHAGILRKGYDSVVVPIQEYSTTNDDFENEIRTNLSNHYDIQPSEVPPIRPVGHHLTHAAGAFYPSGFDEALVVSIDEHGDFVSTAIYEGRGSSLSLIESFGRFNSLGRLYGDITEHLGFRRSNGEGKVMGLAPYGEPDADIESVLESYCTVSDGKYDVTELTFRPRYDATTKLETDLGFGSRYWKDEIEQRYKNLAHHTQELLEETVVELIEYYLDDVDATNVCLAGGVALNCKMNKRV